MLFVGRSREIRVLRAEVSADRPSLVIVYGRRRVGKSALLRHAVRGRSVVYYQATKVADADGQALFRAELERTLGVDPILTGLTGWEALIGYVQRLAASTHPGLTVVLDEFPYLCEANKALPSIVQKVWDSVRSAGTPLALILCGSQVAFMEDLLAERNPLHGRHSAKLDVGPLSFRDIAAFAPDWRADDVLRGYGVFGGLPYYWSLVDGNADLETNIKRLVLADGAPLRDEPVHLLQAEFSSVARYASVLFAVADGCTTRSEIAGRVLARGEEGAILTPYIDKLEALRLLRRVHSLDVPDPGRSRHTRFYIGDSFLAFYYQFVLPNLSALDAGHGAAVYRTHVGPKLDEYMGGRFEEICRQYVSLYGQERLPDVAGKVGKIWGADFDINVAGEFLSDGGFAGECKWSKHATGIGVYQTLSAAVKQTRYYDGADPHLVFFSRSGFAQDLVRAKSNMMTLLTPSDLLSRSPKAASGR